LRYPQRYDAGYRDLMTSAVAEVSNEPAMRVLDVGGGRRPFFPRDERPSTWTYEGLDISSTELRAAPSGSYHEIHESDIANHEAQLDERFDLIVSCWVLEHVFPLDSALRNLRCYLRPRGGLVALFSGKFGAHSIAKRLMPTRLERAVLTQRLGRQDDSIFPAVYDRCWYSALQEFSQGWASYRVIPLYWGASYWSFVPPLERAYLRYEDWACRTERFNLASHYLIVATVPEQPEFRHPA
jgi:SAM-dependent methyltransferase